MLFNIWVPKKWGKISFLFMHIKITLYFQLLKKIYFSSVWFGSDLGGVCLCVCVCVCACAGEWGGRATITDRYVHQSVECQYKSQFLVAEGKCMTWY